MAILEVEHIKKKFGKTDVLKDISFSLEQGEVELDGVQQAGQHRLSHLCFV